MVRERRYTVFKHVDIEKYLNENEVRLLCELESNINFRRQQDKRGLLTAVVVEKDWPEYEPTWRAIEHRVNGTDGSTLVESHTELLNFALAERDCCYDRWSDDEGLIKDVSYLAELAEIDGIIDRAQKARS